MGAGPVPAAAAGVALCATLLGALAPCNAADVEPDGARRQQLVRMVRQDCGSCHGMRLLGGLGPPLTPQALAERPLDSVTATILHGRPGTPMPPWRGMVSDDEAGWIARNLVAGFPSDTTAGTR